jgi:hypothetical protein
MGGMGGATHEREARLARSAYIAAVIQLSRAMQSWEEARVALDPGHGGLVPWTEEQHRLTREAAEAWAAVVAQRRAYETALHPRPTH